MNQNTAQRFDAHDFHERVSNRLQETHHEGEIDGDHLFQNEAGLEPRPDLKPAAVLIAIIERANVPYVMLTTRTLALKSHSGQIAFPGGKIDEEDASPEAAALREAEEEIGLSADHINILAKMPIYKSGSGYAIYPVVAKIEGDPELKLSPDEVEDCFEVPLEFLMNPDNHRLDSKIWEDKRRYFYIMPYQGEDGINRHIWGVTAGIIRRLYERLYL